MAKHRTPSVPARTKQDNANAKPSGTSNENTEVQPAITLSGNRRKDHFQIEVGGEVVELTHAALKALVKLVIARGGAASGFVRIPRLAIYRLRQTLDHALNKGFGERLIDRKSVV